MGRLRLARFCEKCNPHSTQRKQSNKSLVAQHRPFSLVDAIPLHNNVRRAEIFRASYTMFDRLMLLRLFFHIISLLNSFAGITAAQDACIYRSGAIPVNSVVVVKHTIHIINSVPYNTTLQVNTDLTITVDNAPTSLDFLTTYYSRSTAIETMNGSVPRSGEL